MNLTPHGQDQAWKKLTQLASQPPQGLIFTGPADDSPPHIGKYAAAKAWFQLINCKNLASTQVYSAMPEPCGNCISCKKIAENKNVDLIQIGLADDGPVASIGVDELRPLKKMLCFPPYESKFRFILINHAHKLTVAAANSILKILEEPPAHTRFIFITHERSLLLPTIISRCQFIQFKPLSTNHNLEESELESGFSKCILEQSQNALTACKDKQAQAYKIANQALYAIHLKNRLQLNTNKKLLALALEELKSLV